MKHLLITIALALPGVVPAMASQELAKTRSCMACHAVDKKLVGPAFKAVAVRYANQSSAAGMLAEKIIKGGGGVWGPVPMPANPQVSKSEAQKLSAWILNLK